MKHLKESNMNYVQHWWLATSCGIVLLIHAWFPFLLKNYVSKRVCRMDTRLLEDLKDFYIWKRYINDPKFIEDWTKNRDGVLKSVQRSSMSK